MPQTDDQSTEKSASVVNTSKIRKSYPISNGEAETLNADCPGSVTGWVNRERPSGGMKLKPR